MKAAASQRILAAVAGCLITTAAAGTAGAAPLVLQPAAEGPVAGPVAPVVAETGSFERALGGDVGFSVSQGSSDMYWNIHKLVVCDLLRAGPFICAPGSVR
ncbi:hypothetical protein ACFXO9_02355 [Nocardia tengchongensis]|uniref:hypothetical protein n=1 Tax=Nocardia tengchongensis TaxID=2055889 RepID=UPI003660B39F